MKILADTSIWIDCLRNKEALIADRLRAGDVVMHDFVIGEIMLGGIDPTRMAMLQDMRRCSRASHEEVLRLITERKLAGRGLGYVDSHLLAAAIINRLQLWTLDKALQTAARDLGCGMPVH